MERTKRKDRLGALAQILIENPNRLHTLGEFCEKFNTAKSTISEDVELLRASIAEYGFGRIETVPGAAGGARYRPIPTEEQTRKTLQRLAARLSEPGRMLPGGFLYNSDISTEPEVAERIGQILAARYYSAAPDLVLTMETKGIPIAMMTARMLNVPLVIARRDSRAYEGSAVKINYVAGDNGSRIETMALARRAVKAGQRALIIDDFMKGGGTLQGMVDMMHEFQAQVVGVGVMIATAEPAEKRVKGAHSLLVLRSYDMATGAGVVTPADEYL